MSKTKVTRNYEQPRGGFKITGNTARAPFMESIQSQRNETNTFDLTHDIKLSGEMGNIIPLGAIECYPGDSFEIGADLFTRIAPTIFPIMHRVNQSIVCAFVPRRLLWAEHEDFIAGKATGGRPKIEVSLTQTDEENAFLDYFGVPPFNVVGSGVNKLINAEPFAAYQKMYEDLFRDQNVIAEVDYMCTSGTQSTGKMQELLKMRRVSWQRDYFTSMLPTPQAETAVDVPIGTVIIDPDWAANGSDPVFEDSTGALPTGSNPLNQDAGAGQILTGAPATQVAYNPDGSLITDPVTVNTLRRALQLQRIKEMFIRGGRRFKEVIKSAFGVDASDPRLDRAEYVFGVKTPIVISEVLNTTGGFSALDPTDPTSRVQGDMAGHGVAVARNDRYNDYHVKEHGYLVFVTFVTPNSNYSQGIPKMFLKTDYEEELWPQFAHLGEQAVKKEELFAYELDGSEDVGYLPMYSELRFINSRIAGQFRTTLNSWHLSREMDAATWGLNQEFMEVSPEDVTRVFAVQTAGNHNLFMDILLRLKVRRQLPLYGTPNL
ncbi:MAG: major capsid protein [Microviridae sp.]|nr:MAG: major capsid protein [Microviridae sp.]